jgi:hypothetical protein
MTEKASTEHEYQPGTGITLQSILFALKLIKEKCPQDWAELTRIGLA